MKESDRRETMITWLTREDFINEVPKKIIPGNSVLDVGPGIQPQAYFTPKFHILIEPYLPYIQRIQARTRKSEYIYLNATWDRILPFIPDKTIDSIFAMDVIEHLPKEDGLRFIAEAERIARKQILIYTRLGWYPQSYDHDTLDRWGMQGGQWQSHQSSWEPSDFPVEWNHYCCKSYHFLDQNDQPLEEPVGAFWAIRTFDTGVESIDSIDLLREIRSVDILRYMVNRALEQLTLRLRSRSR